MGSLLFIILAAFASPVANAEPAESGFIPSGWAAFPQAYIGSHIRAAEGGGYVLEARPNAWLDLLHGRR